MSKHPIVHIELSAHDPREAAKFYSAVFGWETQDMPEMNYVTFDAAPGGGFNPVGEETRAGDVFVYIGTDDIEASLAKVEEHGGKIMLPKTEIPGIGWFAFFVDPTGNRIGLFKNLPQGE